MHVDLDLDLISHWRQEEEPRWVIDMGTTTPRVPILLLVWIDPVIPTRHPCSLH
jgi:hypothetical protein